MKSYKEYLWFNTKKKRESINITAQVEACLRESGIRDSASSTAHSSVCASRWAR